MRGSHRSSTESTVVISYRGAKYADRGRTMIDAIENTGAKCIIVEPFFGDEKRCEELLKNHKQYAEVINEILDTAITNKL